jgi:predicted amidohydrolase YtcJ
MNAPRGWRRVLTLCIALTTCVAAARPAPTPAVVLVHGHIYTADAAHPWAQALAVRDGRIEAIGSDREVLARRRADARVVDLKGRTVLPGLIDSHVHMLFGALELHGFSLSNPDRSITPAHPDALVAAIRAFAAAHPREPLLIGRADFDTAPPAAPNHALLDRAIADRPLIIHGMTEHALWVNAAALRFAGITDDPVPDPEEERGVIRDASGHPSGVLLEAAQELIERAVLKQLPRDELLAQLRVAAHYLNSLGITSVVNATGDLQEIELYAMLHERGELTVRTRTAFGAIAVPQRLTSRFLADLETARNRYHDDWVAANLVKFFADGSSGFIPPLVYRPADYRALVQELDRRGFQLMTHAERGDSVHMVLDAYQHAIEVNGARDRRLRIEHNFVVNDEDLLRYAQQHVIVSAQPLFCCSDIGTGYDPKDPTTADRWHSLLASGATLSFGSDWPCSWPPDPFQNIQQAVTRAIWHSDDTADIAGLPIDGAHQGGSVATGKVYAAAERIGVREAVDAYTRSAAYAMFAEDRVGVLGVGKAADLVVLSQDIFAVPAEQIGRTHALMTLVGGQVVFDAAAPNETEPRQLSAPASQAVARF